MITKNLMIALGISALLMVVTAIPNLNSVLNFSGGSNQLAAANQPPPPPLHATCAPSKNPVNVNDTVTWTASVVGGLAPYTFSWSDVSGVVKTNFKYGLTPTDSIDRTYTTAGVKKMGFSTMDTSGQNTAWAFCPDLTVSDSSSTASVASTTTTGDTTNTTAGSTASPTATLTMDGQTSRTYNVGDTVHYVWSSSNADTFSSSYTSPSCGSGTWVAGTANGTSNAVVPSSAAGCVYTITFTAKNSKTGQTVTANVVQTFNSNTSKNTTTSSVASSAVSSTASPVAGTATATTTVPAETGSIKPACSSAAGNSVVMAPDKTNNYNPAISAMTNYGRTFIDQTISGTDDCGNVIKVTAATSLAGAIASIKVGNEEFISSGAHGAALQYALHAHYSDYGNHGQATEAYNPTEAGGYNDDIGINATAYPSWHGPSSSAIFSLGTVNNVIKTSTRLAMWLKSGQRSGYNGDLAWYPNTGPLAAAYSMALSPYFLTKNISIGVDTKYGHLSNVILSHDKVTIDPNESSNTYDATLIAYLLPQMSKHYTYDPVTKVLAPTTQDASVHAEFPLNTGKNLPIIAVSTLTGNAFAVYAPKLQNRNDTKAGYFLYNYNGVSNSMISASTGYPAFRAIQINYAATNVGSSTTYKNDVMNYDTYFVVGNLDSVQRSISILDAEFRTSSSLNATATATLTVDGQSSHTYNVGDTIHYAWNSSNADTFSSTYTSTNCGGISGAWIANTANGTYDAPIPSSFAGCVITVTYKAKNSLVGTTSTSVVVTVNSPVVTQVVVASSTTPIVAAATTTTVATTTARCTNSSPEAPIYVIMGQSNAVGLGQISQVGPTLAELDTYNWPFKVWMNTTQTSWTAGTSLKTIQGGNFGPELGLAKALAKSGEKDFYVFKYAVGATSFMNWYFAASGGSYLYYYAIANLNTAKSQICDTGKKPVVRALFWMQGESDAMSAALTTAYISNLTGLVNGTRSNMASSTTPFVIGLIDSVSGLWTYATGVRNSQYYVASILSKVGVVETNDLPLYNASCSGGNGAYCYAHYNSAGQLTLGQRFYDKYVSLR